ncbi:hypothetical protein [Rhodococcus tukisamuensis]|uniref:Major Facilitator Superfamily protein n=1 Tax=Rhodococcus tukisamuensis TaxID=168276 RepID=A0A1G7EPA6_9NOCA|nr:hypothetical protein [Rhodococcus tukisamuensis]SDE65553.1 hypothetical protein SAMN05444580_1262 [Rhodococcus tukisamuensis]
MILLGIGSFFAAGSSGPVTALVASLIHPSLRASGFGTLTLAYTFLGMALGPFVIGVVADQAGLLRALQLAPLVGLMTVAVLSVGRRRYPTSLRTLAALTGPVSIQGDPRQVDL